MNELSFGVERYLLWYLHPLVIDDNLHRTAGKAGEGVGSVRITFQFGREIFASIIVDDGQECFSPFDGSI